MREQWPRAAPALVSAMAAESLFQIEQALEQSRPLVALSCRQIARAFLAGARGSHWRENFLRIAKLACKEGQHELSCCALLAEMLVEAADSSEANASANAAAPAGASGDNDASRRPHAAAPTRSSPPNKRARTSSATSERTAEHGGENRSGGASDGASGGTDGGRSDSGSAELADVASLVRSRGRGARVACVEDIVTRRLEVVDTRPTDRSKPHHHGRCPAGHLSVRPAWGGGGKLVPHLPSDIMSALKFGTKDMNREYKLLGWDLRTTATRFMALKHAVGFECASDPSVLRNGVGARTPFRQALHVDGAPSLIIPVESSGCALDCLMKPDDPATDFLFRVTIQIPAGYCVVFAADTIHGGASGNGQTEDKRVHAYLDFEGGNGSRRDGYGVGVSATGNRQRTLEDLLEEKGDSCLKDVPTRGQLQEQVGPVISLVCKVSRKDGHEYEPQNGHNA